MKCKNCFACFADGYEYPEYYCAAGVPEDGKMVTDGGCRYTAKIIERRMKRLDHLKNKQYEGIDEWYAERQMLEDAMMAAISEAAKEIWYAEVVFAARNTDGSLSELNTNSVMSDLAYTVLHKYEEKSQAAELKFCNKCRWRNRPQKCSCCRRNLRMKDNYDPVDNV